MRVLLEVCYHRDDAPVRMCEMWGVNLPVAPIGCPLLSRPPDVLTTHLSATWYRSPPLAFLLQIPVLKALQSQVSQYIRRLNLLYTGGVCVRV